MESQPLILDACCTLTLSATGRIEEILERLPYRFLVAARGRAEAQWLRIECSEAREPVELQPLLDAGLLVETSLRTPDEEALYVELGAVLDTGEAEAAALAILRGYVLATDERKARNLLAKRVPAPSLRTTQELLREWQTVCELPDTEVAEVLRRVSYRATYRPKASAPLGAWWRSLAGEE